MTVEESRDCDVVLRIFVCASYAHAGSYYKGLDLGPLKSTE